MGYVIAKKQNKIEKSCWNLIWYCVYFVSIFTFLIPMYRTAPLWLAITILSLGKWIFPACASWWFLSPSFGYKTLEASAIIPTEFLYGNHFWLGSKDECGLINNPKTVRLSESHYIETNKHLLTKPTDLEFSYKVVWANITRSPFEADNRYFRNMEILHLGLCLPITCAKHDLQIISTEYLSNNKTIPKRVFDMDVNNIEVNELILSADYVYKKTLITFGTILLLTLIIIMLSLTPLKNTSGLKTVLNAFHPKQNFDTIFIWKPTKFPEINGLKFFGAIMILLFHVQFFGLYKLTSRFNGFVYAETLENQFITTGGHFIEAFFCASGFLLTYNLLKNQKQAETLAKASFLDTFKFLSLSLFKRLVRIVPLYVVMMLLTELASTYYTETAVIKLWDEDGFNCRNYWWRNLLFISNFYPHYDMCMNWTWTISCEMQFYIYAILLYVFYCKNERGAKIFFATTCGFITIISTYFLIKHDFKLTFDAMSKEGQLDDLYQHPLSRVPAYLVGIGMAYFLVKFGSNISKV
uniref:CSON009092 protein n=1 Tax=Culicoides sonorensis TaxID=179676 RepID=A0A336N0S6_CULSO